MCDVCTSNCSLTPARGRSPQSPSSSCMLPAARTHTGMMCLNAASSVQEGPGCTTNTLKLTSLARLIKHVEQLTCLFSCLRNSSACQHH